MLDTNLIEILINSGAIGVMLVLFVTGLIVPKSHLAAKQKECDEKDAQIKLERARADIAQQQFGLTGLQLMQSLQDIAYDRRQSWQQPDPPPIRYTALPAASEPSHGEGANP